jgi:pimeloyl-ACP methyl ester carboxylesterase
MPYDCCPGFLRSYHFFKINANEGKDKKTEKSSGLKPGKRDDPVIYLSGGPGARASMYVKRLKEHGLIKHRDLYFLEQRGIGTSAEFCPNFINRKPQTSDVATFKEYLDAAHTHVSDCAKNAAKAGVDLGGYNTLENARDVKALRRALKIDRWNVWGISYGSILGQAYIKEDAEGIRAIVLDAVVPLDVRRVPISWRTVHWYDRDLKKLDKLCQAQSGCAERYPDLGQRIRKAVTSVKDRPIVVEVKDTERFPSKKARFFEDTVGFLPFVMLYEQTNYPALPGVIVAWTDAVERRQGALFKALALMQHAFMDMSHGMHNAIMCRDGDIEAQVAAIRRDSAEHPILAGAMGTVDWFERGARLCHELGMAPRDAAEYSPVKTDIPALIVEGDMDPITPPPQAKAILPGFTKGTYVQFPYAGHGPTRSVKCAGDMLNKFFDDPRAKPDLSCVKQVKPPDFYVPLYETSALARFAAMALEDKKSLIGPLAPGGLCLLISIVAFFVLTVAPLIRRIEKRSAARSSWSRLAAWLAAALAVASAVLLGSAIGVSVDASEMLPLFGLVPWARLGALAGLLAGLAGLAAMVLTVRAWIKHRLPAGTLLGFLITSLAAVGLSLFWIYWDLGLF